jgi:fatty acid desaturase
VVLRSISAYAREIRPELAPGVFAPARSRLIWLPVHLAVVGFCSAAIAAGWLPWAVALLLSPVIGASFAGLTFLGHETLHGAVVRGRLLRRVVGWLGFLPFVVSPRLWIAWHNRVHHGHANHAGADPDAYPTLREYERSAALRIADLAAPGRRRWSGLLSLIIGFTVQSSHMLLRARSLGLLSRREHRLALAETGLGVLVWIAVAALLGPFAFVAAFVLPLVVANVIVMSFILTNHSLSPLSEVNDPLVNTLSVRTPAWVEFLTLRFGFHVEHHIFPAMSSRHAPAVRAVLRARWPERYQSMPLLDALRSLHHTARVYKDETTLVDPRSGQEWPLPRASR